MAEPFAWFDNPEENKPAPAQGVGLFSWFDQEAAQPIEKDKPGFFQEAGNSFMNNLYKTTGLLTGGPQTIYGYAADDKEQLKAGLERIKGWVDSADQEYPESVSLEKLVEDPSLENIKLYFAGALGTLASTVPTLITGVVGGGASVALGLGRKAGERTAANMLAKGATAEVAEAAAKGIERKVLTAAILAGSAPTAFTMNTAETVSSLAEADPNNTHPGLALGIGAFKTMLDFVGEGAVLNSFLRTGNKTLVRDALANRFGGRMANALVGAGGAAGIEGVTEGIQELADVVGEELVAPGKNADLHKLAIRLADSAIKGAVAGGAGGGIGGLFKPSEPAPAKPAQVAQEVKADQGLPTDTPTSPNVPGRPNVEEAGSPGYSPNFTEVRVMNDLNAQLANRFGFSPDTIALDANQHDEVRAILGLPPLAEVKAEEPQPNKTPLPQEMQGPDTPQSEVQKWLNGAAAMPADGQEIKLLDAQDNNIIPGLRALTVKLLGPEAAERVGFTDRLMLPEWITKEYFPGATELRGITRDFPGVGPVAAVALNIGEPRYTTIHESTHIAERLGILPQNATQIVDANPQAVAALLQQAAKEGYTDMGAANITDLAANKPRENIAYAMESYLYLRDKGKVPGAAGPLRALLEPVYNFFNRIRSYLRGHGFTSFNDVLDGFASGKYAQKASAAQKTAALYGAPQAAILAWHGSPHVHNKFSNEKIGTGEGAQAYGWGHYFSSSEAIARWYKEKLSSERKKITFDGKEFAPIPYDFTGHLSPELQAKEYILNEGGIQKAYDRMSKEIRWAANNIKKFKEILSEYDSLSKGILTGESTKVALEEQQNKFDEVNAAYMWLAENRNRFKEEGGGRLYKVNLAPEEHQLLDWDKPLSQQTPYVKNALTAFAMNNSAIYEQMVPHQQIRGKDIYKELSTRIAYKQGDGTYGKAGQPDELASQKLAEYGIKGIKYLAGTSRRKGEGDYNYVIFDDNDIQIEDIQAAVLGKATKEIPSIKVEDPGRQMMWHEQWLNHTSAIANKFPAARRFANALRTMNLERQKLMTEGRTLLQPFHDLKAEASARVNKMVILSDSNNRFATPEQGGLVLKSEAGQVLSTLTDPKEIEAYNAYRKAGELYKDGLRKSLLQALDQPLTTTPASLEKEAAALSDGPEKILLLNLAKSLEEIAARNFYMPHMREGSHSIAVKDAAGKETLYYEKFNLPKFGQKKFLLELEKRLKAAYPTGKIGNVRKDVRADMGSSLLGTVGLVEGLASVFDATDSKTAEQMFNRLKTEMAQRSFKQHLRERKNIPGYITPSNEKDYALIAMDRYIPSVSNFLAKQASQPEMDAGFKEVAEANDPRLLKWATKLKEYVASVHEEAGWLRTLAFHAFLGGNLSSALINLTQVPLAGIPFMGQFGRDTMAYFPKASIDAQRSVDFRDLLLGRPLAPADRLTYLPVDERAFLQMLQDEGTISPIQLKNTEANIEDTVRKWNAPRAVTQPLLKLLAISGAPFAVTEQANRVTMALAAYRWAKNTPKWEERVKPQWEANRMAGTALTPTSFARYVVENTQFMMDKANRPAFTQGTLPSVATQFMSYPIQMMELMGNLWSGSGLGAKGKFALAGMLFGLWTLGGLWAQPGADLTRRLMEMLAKLTGRTINLDMMARQWLKELGLDKATAEVIMKGPWRLTGMDISGRVDINPIKIGNLTGATSLAEIGPAGGAIMGILASVMRDWNQDKPMKALVDANPIMQVAVKNAVEAFQSKTQGFTDQKGRTIIGPEHVTKTMAAMKVLGFTPTEVAEARELKGFDQTVVDSQKGRTEAFARRVADAQLEIVRSRAANSPERAMEAMARLAKVQKEMIETNKGKALADMINIKGVFDSAKKQVAEDLTGGYGSLLKVKGKPLMKRPALLDLREP